MDSNPSPSHLSRSWLPKRSLILAGSIASLLVSTLTCKVQAAAIISEQGITFDFAIAPGASEWSTTTIAGAAGDITTPDAMDARVATITAASVNGALVTSATAGGSGTNAQARHNTTDLYVSTRPTGVALTPLMATLENGAAGRITSLAIDYDLGNYTTQPEEVGLDGFLVYFSLDGMAWTKIPALSGIGTPGKLTANVPVATWEQGAPLYLLWADDNGPATDGGFTLDNVHLVPTVQPVVIGRNLIYNRAHTVGGAPNGTLSTTGNYFLEGANPTAFATTDVVNFSQDGSATISVPSDVTTGGVVVSNNTGTYTIGGAGKISGTFTKSNNGTAVFTSTNSFNKSTISGGTVETQAGALGSGLVTISGGALWKVTTAAQNQNGSLSVGTGGATVQTDFDLSAGGVDGTGLLTKTGIANLTLRGGGTGTGGINVTAGKLLLGGAVGGNGEAITMNGNGLEFINTGEITFSDATNVRTISLGPTGGTISVSAAGGGVILGAMNSLASGGTITKVGDGALRMRADHPGLTVNWIVNAGTLESGAFPSALGTGTVTVNAGGRLAAQNTMVPSNVTLAGGDLGTRSGDLGDFTGAINVTANSTVTMNSYTTPANAQNVTISGVLSGTGDLTLNGNIVTDPTLTKSLIVSNIGNTYAGTFRVSAGQTLTSQALLGVGSTLNGRPVVLSNGTLRVRDDGAGNDGTLNYGNNVTVDTGASALDVGSALGVNTGNTVQFGTLSIGQTLAVTSPNTYKARFNGATTLTADSTFDTTADLILNGAVSGAFGLAKSGTGTLTLSAANTYTGPTSVTAGTLQVNGSLNASSDVMVTGTLSGRGTINGKTTIGAAGTIAPGPGAAALTLAGNFDLSPSSIFSVDIGHGAGATPVAGTDYDQVRIGTGTGTTSTASAIINGAELALNLNGAGIRTNDVFFILLNDGTDATNGLFNNLPDDSTFTTGGIGFRISYDANSATGALTGGNDVALMALIPEPTSAGLLLSAGALLLRRRQRR